MNPKYMEMNQFACIFWSEKFYPTTNEAKIHINKHIMWDTLQREHAYYLIIILVHWVQVELIKGLIGLFLKTKHHNLISMKVLKYFLTQANLCWLNYADGLHNWIKKQGYQKPTRG